MFARKLYLNSNKSSNLLKLLPLPKNFIGINRSKVSLQSSVSNNKGKAVFISQSSDIYSNLALEDWLYNNMTFTNREILLLWSNNPCVVIGRHQNPYVEANLAYLENLGFPVVRRNSGGGTVYHDLGNLNCTFFTSRERYNRNWNLHSIKDALQTDFNINSEIDCKDNIMIEGLHKVSGTAAKLGRLTAYHHCTLLVNSHVEHLSKSLQGDKSIESNATASVPSPIKNLSSLNSTVTVDALIESVARKYLESSNNVSQDSFGMTLVNPTNDWFPGLDDIKERLQSWKWQFGMTPRFTITRPVTLHFEGSIETVNIAIKTYHGIIEEVKVVPGNESALLSNDLIENAIGPALRGSRYSIDVFQEISSRLSLPHHHMSETTA